jgi:glutamine amidotransferase
MYPETETFRLLSDESRLIVSEPLGELAGAWNPVPESSYGVVAPGHDRLDSFTPKMP